MTGKENEKRKGERKREGKGKRRDSAPGRCYRCPRSDLLPMYPVSPSVACRFFFLFLLLLLLLSVSAVQRVRSPTSAAGGPDVAALPHRHLPSRWTAHGIGWH